MSDVTDQTVTDPMAILIRSTAYSADGGVTWTLPGDSTPLTERPVPTDVPMRFVVSTPGAAAHAPSWATVGDTLEIPQPRQDKRWQHWPPGTAPERGEHCRHLDERRMAFYARPDRWDSRRPQRSEFECKLLAGHDGDHNTEANWNAHVEAEQSRPGGSVEIGFRSWHDSRALDVRNREEATELLRFLSGVFDEAFPR